MTSEAIDSTACRRAAFTLLELLVVVSIIVLLVALLLPALSSVRDTGRDLACRTQLHQFGTAMTEFLVDHDMKLPGLWGAPWTGVNEGEGSIFGSELFELSTFKPKPASEEGELLTYMNARMIRELLRCPGHEQGAFGSGAGSNGFFDYSMIQAFPGARVRLLPASATLIDPNSGLAFRTPVPLLVEEDPAFHMNNSPCCIDFGHTSINRFGTWHPQGSGNYLAIDGSAQHLAFGDASGPQASDWTVIAPSGTPLSLGVPEQYGGWNAR